MGIFSKPTKASVSKGISQAVSGNTAEGMSGKRTSRAPVTVQTDTPEVKVKDDAPKKRLVSRQIELNRMARPKRVKGRPGLARRVRRTVK
jgi:hypothetical protein